MREVILSSLPPPNGHYSHAVVFNGAAYVSGVLPMRVKPGAASRNNLTPYSTSLKQSLKNAKVL